MNFNDFNNPQVAALPRHLKQFIVEQHYEKYTSIDNAVWRYVMRQNYSYLKDVAYYPYIPGLHKAGLTIEKIPSLQEMNDALGKIGWGAVTVDGFIPPAAFMEYQAYRVLVIAADIRQLHILNILLPRHHSRICRSCAHNCRQIITNISAILVQLVQKQCFHQKTLNYMRQYENYRS